MTAYGESPTLVILILRIADDYLSCTASQWTGKHTEETASNNKLIVRVTLSVPLVGRKIVGLSPGG
jgi:hypothetical protein